MPDTEVLVINQDDWQHTEVQAEINSIFSTKGTLRVVCRLCGELKQKVYVSPSISAVCPGCIQLLDAWPLGKDDDDDN